MYNTALKVQDDANAYTQKISQLVRNKYPWENHSTVAQRYLISVFLDKQRLAFVEWSERTKRWGTGLLPPIRLLCCKRVRTARSLKKQSSFYCFAG